MAYGVVRRRAHRRRALDRVGHPRLPLARRSLVAVECLACGRRAPREEAQHAWEAGTAVPRCGCGSPWKPATISFGQALVEADLRRALAAAAACDLFVAVGTSLVVGPINAMLPTAREVGARTAILTASETPFDALADWRIAEPLEVVLPALRARIG